MEASALRATESFNQMAAIGCCQATKKTRREASLAMSVERLERSTNGLKGHCSAIELHARLAKSILSCSGIRVNNFLDILKVGC